MTNSAAAGSGRGRVLIPVLEIGGTHVTAALVLMDGAHSAVMTQHRVPLDAHGTAEELIKAFSTAARLLDHEDAHAVWGIAIPGPFDYERGIGKYVDVGKFDALRGVDVGAALTEALGPRLASVKFVNDATAFALGECAGGAGRDHHRVVCLTLGTGVGSAFIADGIPVEDGPEVPTQGWAYLLQWHGRPLEDTVSRRAIRRAYAELSGQLCDVHEIAERARAGDATAQHVLVRAMTALGEAIGPWVKSFDASVVVVGGSIAGSWDLLVEPLSDSLHPWTDAALVQASLEEHTAALIGAADAAARLLPDEPAARTRPLN